VRGALRDPENASGRTNYSFVAWKQYYNLQHEDKDESRFDGADDNASVLSGETEALKAGVEWQYEDSELDFGNRSPLEEIESESIISKNRFKGSMLSNRGRRQSERASA
jgi:hypothetical protein